MFHKQGSSVGGGVSRKKATDTPLRKTDRQELRQVAQSFFASNDTEVPSGLLDDVFLHNNAHILVRKMFHEKLNKVKLFFRVPLVSSAENKVNVTNNNKVLDTDPPLSWPYTTTTECVWMTIDVGPGEPLVECPSIALLSVIHTFPAVEVPSVVSKYLCRGAHLMRPGILSIPVHNNHHNNNSHSNGNMNANDYEHCLANLGRVVGIRVRGNPQPFAVGMLTPKVDDNAKGVGVHVYMCYGDDIYRNSTALLLKNQLSNRINPIGGADFGNGHFGNVGFLDGAQVRPIVSGANEQEGNDDNGDDDDDDDDDDDNRGDMCKRNSGSNESVTVGQKREDQTEINVVGKQDCNALTMSPDDVLHQATCHALMNLKDKDLPMMLSTFYSNHVLYYRPPGTFIQLKDTSYKKFGTYMLHQEKCALVTLAPDLKDKKNRAAFLKSINRSHPDLRGIRKSNKKNEATETTGAKSGKKIVMLFVIPHWIVALLQLNGSDIKAVNAKALERRGTGYLTSIEVLSILEEYCVRNDLFTTDGTAVTLDGPLTDVLYKKQAPNSTIPLSLARKDLNQAWVAKMDPAFAIVQMPGSHICRMARGDPPKVLLEVSRGVEKKMITRVRGLEDFDIDAVSFCNDVKLRFACAGVVVSEDPKLGALKKGQVELLFQGNLAEELQAFLVGDEALTTHGGAKGSHHDVPRNAIAVTLRKGVPTKKRK